MSDQRPFIPVRFAVLTVSDTRSLAEDRSGQTLADRIAEAGPGFTGRDVTPEALEPIFEKRMDGFSEVFHRISYDKIGTSTIQSRATGGVVNATFVFVLPGSPGACRDAWDGILKAQFDYRHMPCNFVEIMPRLDEHLRRNKS
jgi:molybdenum cofactor biosynthesis protein B